jgi:hypothetical protein
MRRLSSGSRRILTLARPVVPAAPLKAASRAFSAAARATPGTPTRPAAASAGKLRSGRRRRSGAGSHPRPGRSSRVPLCLACGRGCQSLRCGRLLRAAGSAAGFSSGIAGLPYTPVYHFRFIFALRFLTHASRCSRCGSAVASHAATQLIQLRTIWPRYCGALSELPGGMPSDITGSGSKAKVNVVLPVTVLLPCRVGRK